MTILLIVGLSIIIYEFVFPVLRGLSTYIQNLFVVSSHKMAQKAGLEKEEEKETLPEEKETLPEEYVNTIGFHVDHQEEDYDDDEGDYENG